MDSSCATLRANTHLANPSKCGASLNKTIVIGLIELAKGLRYERKERKIDLVFLALLLHQTMAKRLWRASHFHSLINLNKLISVSPLAVVGGQETSLFLRGRNLNIPGTKIHCTHGYLSKEVPGLAFEKVLEQLRTIAKGDYSTPSIEKRKFGNIVYAAVSLPVGEIRSLLDNVYLCHGLATSFWARLVE
ncbi:Squamosa promoter-binding-like protein 15 [Camellia lanceoleosa]|uniref:Squamosa promoter-binding-like protein 15 n=1 Tax=Camellia lanceoleosa TaxID=1840588 RepID=A0ACC0ITD9_9ERIC|nr:Squamosa promoter-binding-like protein 15 [Camellia lanceoleosa]